MVFSSLGDESLYSKGRPNGNNGIVVGALCIGGRIVSTRTSGARQGIVQWILVIKDYFQRKPTAS